MLYIDCVQPSSVFKPVIVDARESCRYCHVKTHMFDDVIWVPGVPMLFASFNATNKIEIAFLEHRIRFLAMY